MIWPAVQAVNFKLVPLEHRVLVVNIVSLGWNCYLSYLNGRKSDVTVEKTFAGIASYHSEAFRISRLLQLYQKSFRNIIHSHSHLTLTLLSPSHPRHRSRISTLALHSILQVHRNIIYLPTYLLPTGPTYYYLPTYLPTNQPSQH
ncbi:hypothetical protein EYC84_006530 [Monilinia fructicola]|uniref:Uncharacterized protein n=1 Tax=Monilinia fructicola TaxID=38448 RepID=A0A5M9K664_MONFR|nr:hypothetical protein EYC84_006530 [Monilinia fructicola]